GRCRQSWCRSLSTHQPAHTRAPRRSPEFLSRNERNHTLASIVKKRISCDEKCFGRLQAFKDCLDLPSPTPPPNVNLQPELLGAFLYFLSVSLGVRIALVQKKCNRASCGYKLPQQFQPFSDQRTGKLADPRDASAWLIEAGDETELDWITTAEEDDR